MAPIRRRLTRLAALVGSVVVLSACSIIELEENPLTTFEPAGPFAEEIDGLFWLVFWIATGVFILVMGALVVILFVFRDRHKDDQKHPKQLHGSPKLEVLWTVIPALILAAIAVPTVSSIFDLTECSPDAMEVEVIGHQWWFEYHYPEADIDTANVMVIPAGEEICAQMTSEDVIHSFWIPALTGKRDVVPGQTTTLRLQADEPGEYWGHCAEFCGLSHSLMRARVQAVPAAEFDQWVENQQQPAPVPEEGDPTYDGYQTFINKGCTQCHNYRTDSEDGPPLIRPEAFSGPELTHFASRNVFAGAVLPEEDQTHSEALKAWLANPPEVKPGSFMPPLGLTEQEIDALIVWLESLE
jgi:cytochrome c oxidase subunit 2